MSVNKAILIGRLGKDPELRYTASGRAVATFSLATSEVYQNQEGQRQENTTWHNIVCWGKTAELAKEYLRKGREVYLEGRIANRSYDDKDGNKRYISEVVVQNLKFLGSRQQGEPGGAADDAEPSPSPAASGGDEDDLPF
jgi:single-strand DNA-binding protein